MPPYAGLDNNNLPTWDLLPWDGRWLLPRRQVPSLYRNYWCFLTEIQHCDGFCRWRYRTLVKDSNNKSLFVAFYLDNYAGFDWDQLDTGHTLAIMNAEQHGFADGTQGVRVESMDGVHVSMAEEMTIS